MINKKRTILILSLLAFTSVAQAADEAPSLQGMKAIISPQQIDMLLQKFQPSMKEGQRNQISNLVQQQLDQLSAQELLQLANTKIKDMPDLVKQHISQMPPEELSKIKQALKQQNK
jgi:hypothetical protein